jgi:hypothetical protein
MEPKHKVTVTYAPREVVIRVELADERVLDLDEIERSLREKFHATLNRVECSIEIPESTHKFDTLKCIGCQLDEPGQKAHMEYGGCLYASSDSDSDR